MRKDELELSLRGLTIGYYWDGAISVSISGLTRDEFDHLPGQERSVTREDVGKKECPRGH